MIKSININDVANWTRIRVPRANLYKWSVTGSRFGNEFQYEEMCTWCEDSIPDDGWVSVIALDGTKQFYIKDPKHVTMFMLKWGEYTDAYR